MSRNMIGLLVGALLLVQFANAVPVPREEIEDYVFLETAIFMEDVLLEGRHLYRNINATANKFEPKSAKLNDYLNEFNACFTKLGISIWEGLNPKETEGIFKLFDTFFEILKRYENEDFPAELSLKENGYEAFNTYYEKGFQKLSEDLTARVGQYIDDLSSEEKKTGDNEKLIHWFEEFKAKTTTRTFTDLGPLLELFD